ncbi:phage/plasmid replication protein, II/X family [Shewanella sp. D64]|uniref:phage/plasmid replication protein, II/X family n=1 Tax=unclassified Shewanella TaxID=196818 RepID=UPI0022BA5B57|nr:MULTISPECIES: phage/plasmid replication protein, II/X family [unclassified Shewanella]MEC4724001.1 phage/plasmid replication protein, II/X family [Shewanella sp. D64]MEC4736021.1 phage/plasmid replication protein, II/X family [Shewanella sp. E94]WBJ98034.1 phage/plasmid replication protein, II/X family [Shewanella sp. MTB7]WBJ98044.1 phage/plasmid replication protein, II/X family [Shewanella sp. MTB7]
MNDFQALRIPFLDKHVLTTLSQDKFVSFVNMDDCAKAGLNVAPRSILRNDDGTYEIQDLMHPWDSIPSSYTGIAFKVYQGGGFRDCPCVELKASPAKLIQGHNVYGSESFELGVRTILRCLTSSLPEFSKMLDFEQAVLFRADATYSIQLPTSDCLASALDSIANFSNRYLRPSRDGDYETTIYFNRERGNSNTGRASSLCIYSKLDEVIHQLMNLKAKQKKERTNIYDPVIEQLESDDLQNFATNRLRFESRCCVRMFERLGIPLLVKDLLSFISAYESEKGLGSFCRYIWEEAMKDMLSAIEGQEITVIHDAKVKKLLHTEYDTITKTGRLRKAKAVRLFGFYRRLCTEGYKKVKRTMGITGKSSFYSHCNMLMSVGMSKFQLQNLHKDETLPLVHLLKFDFDKQRPASYVEPEMPCANLSYSEFLVALVEPDIFENPDLLTPERRLAIQLDQLGLQSSFVSGLKAGRSVRLNESESLSLAFFDDGDFRLVSNSDLWESKQKLERIRKAFKGESPNGFTCSDIHKTTISKG